MTRLGLTESGAVMKKALQKIPLVEEWTPNISPFALPLTLFSARCMDQRLPFQGKNRNFAAAVKTDEADSPMQPNETINLTKKATSTEKNEDYTGGAYDKHFPY